MYPRPEAQNVSLPALTLVCWDASCQLQSMKMTLPNPVGGDKSGSQEFITDTRMLVHGKSWSVYPNQWQETAPNWDKKTADSPEAEEEA